MSLQVAPELVQSAAQNLANIHSTLEDASASVAAPTTGVAAAAEDEVSAGVAALFSSFGQEYQVLSAQAQAFHASFVNMLNAGAGAYLSTEIANAEQNLLNNVSAPAQGLLGSVGGSSGGALGAFVSSVGAAQPAAVSVLGGLGGGTVGSLVGALGAGTPVGPLLGSVGGGTVGSLVGGLGGGLPVGSLLGGLSGGLPVGSLLTGLGGGSLVSSLNGVVTALENGGVVPLLSGQLGTGLQTLSGDIAALPALLQSPGSALLPGLLNAGASTGSAVGPYQSLFDNTVANLQTLGGVINANPAPFLNQVITNQMAYAHTLQADLQYVFQNFPAVLAAVPANIQASIQALLAFNPAPYVQQFITNQMAYANIISTSLTNAGHDFVAGLQQLPSAFQSAYQAFAAGNISGAVGDITGGLAGLFITGVNITTTGNVFVPPGLIATVTPTGTIGDLLPILTIPGMMAQNFTNLLPPGSIAAQMSQNFTNVLNTLNDTSLTSDALITVNFIPPFIHPSLDVTAGLPVALTIESLGGPVNALEGATAGATQFAAQIQTGNTAGAISTFFNGPAFVTNDFLNGESTLPLTFDIGGHPTTINLPMDGLLVPQTPYTASIDTGLPPPFATITVPVGGTPISGLATGLLGYAPEQLALAITP